MLDGHDLGHAVGDARSGWFAVASAQGRGPYAEADPVAGIGGGAPTLFLYDCYPGGTGLCERLYDLRGELVARTRAAIERCTCERGCPGCIGPGGTSEAKRLAARLLGLLADALGDRATDDKARRAAARAEVAEGATL
jgi:DEAD/DEAH box helicase domain-containing protein